VAVMEVYSDASEIGGHLAIGTLLFRKKNIKPFEKKWRAMLRKYDITYFHMTDCNATPPRGPHKHQTEKECDACAREAIAIILEFATKGCIFSVKKSDFYEIITERGIMPNPFTLGAWFTLFDIRNWADHRDPIARISYVFEAGDEHQKDANALLTGIAEQPERAEAFRYRNHAFVPKISSYPAQAADILAWHGAKHIHRRSAGNYRLRGDFNEIITKLHVTDGYHEPQWLQQLVEVAKRRAGKYGNELAGLAFRLTEANARQLSSRFAEILSRDGDLAKGLKEFLELPELGA
jgi:hypothetical protein